MIQKLAEENQIIQGQDFTITCEASGSPRPTIRWTKVHESLGNNVHQNGNVLRIISARPENRGIYLCIAENDAGTDQMNTFIDIERKLKYLVSRFETHCHIQKSYKRCTINLSQLF